MMRIRKYTSTDAAAILSWTRDEKAFYQWSAGVLGTYPITEDDFAFVENLDAFTAYDDDGIVGFFTLRKPSEQNILRIGFVIVDPDKRGKGYGKQMMKLAVDYAFERGAEAVSLGVFENNLPAYYCYKAAGFEDVVLDETEMYEVLGETWNCREMIRRNEG